MGEHDQGDVAVNTGPGTALVVVQAQLTLNLLELELWYRIFMHKGMGWNTNPSAWEARGTRAGNLSLSS